MSVGTTVRSARESASMTIDELSEKTRLRRALLLGIERDDFSTCGGNVYARGHLRTIAPLIGLDTTDLIEEFDRSHVPVVESLQESSMSFSESPSAMSNLPWGKLGALAGAVAAVALVWALVPGFHGASATNSASSIPKAVVSQSATQAAGVDPSANAVATKPNSVSVIVTSSTGSSWLAVTNSSGAQLFTSMLHRGESKAFTDPQQIYLTIGNAGGVDLQVNGKSLGSPGGDGQVVHLAFGPGSPTAG
ncbi:cytoskeleton protein RodZ [mine drainage metagenome]|uniref:Cytoskeleton protein RodZ n=1 Tax=mine drainage metagenome TaxID=410659 RepID=A0A1J5QHX0_9ZZZZ